MDLPKAVQVCEVAPRDGFQNEDQWIPTGVKIDIVKDLAATGVSQIEISSFVHPKAIPQLRDAEEVVTGVLELTDVELRALVPNLKGAERAASVGIRKFKLMLSATDSHSLANANCTVDEAMRGLDPIMEFATVHGIDVIGSISVAFGCPFEGVVPIEQIAKIVGHYHTMGIRESSLADTVGLANPRRIDTYVGHLLAKYPDMRYSMHLHNTRGMAFANALAALANGVTHFDASVAGLGGCPYAPGATGNIATEDLVNAFEEMGISTGIDLDALVLVAEKVRHTLGHDGGSFLLHAGPCSKLHDKPTGQIKQG